MIRAHKLDGMSVSFVYCKCKISAYLCMVHIHIEETNIKTEVCSTVNC